MNFCRTHEFRPIPASTRTISLFIAYLTNYRSAVTSKHLEFSTVCNYVASLTSLHAKHGAAEPDLTHARIRMALAGVRRLRTEAPNRKNGIEMSHLIAIHAHLCHVDPNKRRLFWASCLILFFSMLRKSNVFSSGNRDSALHVADVVPCHGGLKLKVSSIKNTRFRGVKYDLKLPRLQGNVLCPTKAVLGLCATVKHLPDTVPLLTVVHGDSYTPYTAKEFVGSMRNVLHIAGYDASRFSVHSFRRGSATFAASIGIPTEAIKAQGTWRSTCYERYIDRDKQLREDFASKMGAAASAFRQP